MLVIGLFGMALGFVINILDPFIYTEKVRLLAPASLRNTTLGGITIMALLVALLAQPLVGRLSDRTRSRWGRRAPYLLAGTVGVVLFLALVVGAESLWLLGVAAMLLSASTNTAQSAWQALIPDTVPPAQRGTAAGVKTVLELVGVVAGVAAASFTLSRGLVWAAPVTAVGLWLIILAVTLAVLRQNGLTRGTPEETAPSQAPTLWLRFSPKTVGRILAQTSGPFRWWMLNRFLFWSAAIAIRTFMLNYMEDVLGFTPAQAQTMSGQLLLVLGAGVFVLALPAGAAADHLGRRPLLGAAGILAAVGAILFIIWGDLTTLFVAAGLIAAGAGIFSGASWALATDLAPPGEGAQSLALANAATVVGSIGGRLGGPLIDGLNHLTGSSTAGYMAVFALAALGFVASSVVVVKIGKSRDREIGGLPQFPIRSSKKNNKSVNRET